MFSMKQWYPCLPSSPPRPSAFTRSIAVAQHADLPSLPQIFSVAQRRGVILSLDSFGPFFKVSARNSQNEMLGTAHGLVKVWFHGRILHLDSIRMTQLALLAEKPVFGLALLLGAVAVRYGHDAGCKRVELLAIEDSDLYHSKLVRYYTRMGFESVYRVSGESLKDIPHMLIWGGRGTRMDADTRELLLKWAPAFRKCAG